MSIAIRSGKPITLPNDSEPEPDIAIVQKLGREYLSHHPYPENIFWLIEYSNSSLEKDLTVKTKIYAEVGIKEYWVVNLKKRQLIVFREPQESEYAFKSTLSTGEVYSLSFPDVAVSVNSIIEIIGSEELLAEIIDKQKEINKAQAKALGKYFHVDASLFF